MKKRVMAVGLALALGACANAVDRGLTHFNAGQYDQAAAQWNTLARQGDPAAQNNLGLLWKDGLGSTPKDPHQAAAWFLKAAQQGLPIAMVNLAKVQLELNQPDPALSWLNMAARWNNAEAIGMLRSMSAPVPAPDLYQAQQQQVAVQQQQATQNLGPGLGVLACALVGGGAGCGPQGSQLPSVSSYRDTTTMYPLRSDLLRRSDDGQRLEHTCRYADGTVINSGRDRCPPSITGGR